MNESAHDHSTERSNLAELGSWLKAAREKEGVTLEDVSSITRIGKNYLEAIEEGAESKLPSQAYTRGFIRLYAAHLGLPAEDVLSRLENRTTETLISPTGLLPSSPVSKGRAIPFLPILIITALLVLVSASAYYFFSQGTTPKDDVQVKTQASAVTTTPVKGPASIGAEHLPVTPAVSAPNETRSAETQGLILRLKAVADVRIHITIDDAVSQDYDLVTGDLVEWKAEASFRLDLDNAAAVEGELDGVRLRPFGDPGKSAHLLLNVNGVHQE